MNFMEREHWKPSRHRIEEHDMLNWLKANRKVMNKGEKEMTEVDKKKFQRGYKKVIRAMLKSLNGRQEVMTYGVGLINKKNNNSQ